MFLRLADYSSLTGEPQIPSRVSLKDVEGIPNTERRRRPRDHRDCSDEAINQGKMAATRTCKDHTLSQTLWMESGPANTLIVTWDTDFGRLVSSMDLIKKKPKTLKVFLLTYLWVYQETIKRVKITKLVQISWK